jgi:hypothetical protein
VVPASASSAVTAGTSGEKTADPSECVAAALELGYRFLDCAEFYANEKGVGEGIKRSGVPRSELYLASKVWTTTIHAGPEAVQAQLEKTLADLGTDYLDLYCIHWPVPGKHVEAYMQLEKVRKRLLAIRRAIWRAPCRAPLHHVKPRCFAGQNGKAWPRALLSLGTANPSSHTCFPMLSSSPRRRDPQVRFVH